MQKLSAATLRNVLWSTLNEVKDGKLEPATADAVAAQSREILRSIKTQLSILAYAKKQVTQEMVEFATSEGNE